MSVLEAKEYICSGRDLEPEELQIINSGRVCHDTEELASECFVLVKNTADRCVDISIKFTGEKNKDAVVLSVPLNTRVSKLKSMLLKGKYTKWSVTGQRMIASSKVMKDYHIIGDYIIHSGKKGACPLSIHLSQTIDSRAEMEIHATFPNNHEVKFYLEFGIPIYYAKDILEKQFAFPKDINYIFVLENGFPLSDLNKCLLDYGIVPSAGKKLRVKLLLARDATSLHNVFDGNLSSFSLSKGSSKCDVTSNVVESSSRASSPVPSTANLKKKPGKKRKSNACNMFAGMKKGFLSQSGKRKKK